MPLDPRGQLAEDLPQLGQGEMLRTVSTPDQVLKVRERRFGVAFQALPKAPRGIVRAERAHPGRDPAPEDEQLEGLGINN